MSGNRNHAKGAETERMVAKYLKAWWPEVDRRLREGRQDDQGDLDGVPFTTVQVKYWEKPRLQEWVTQTLKQRDAAGNPLCLIISRVKYKPVEQWDAYVPGWLLLGGGLNEGEAWTWVRMDLALAVVFVQNKIKAWEDGTCFPLPPSLRTTA